MNKVIKVIDTLLSNEQKLKISWEIFTESMPFIEWATKSIPNAIIGLLMIFLAFAIPIGTIIIIKELWNR